MKKALRHILVLNLNDRKLKTLNCGTKEYIRNVISSRWKNFMKEFGKEKSSLIAEEYFRGRKKAKGKQFPG